VLPRFSLEGGGVEAAGLPLSWGEALNVLVGPGAPSWGGPFLGEDETWTEPAELVGSALKNRRTGDKKLKDSEEKP